MKQYIDFNYVEPQHKAVDARLRNWAAWVRVRKGTAWASSVIWRMVKSNARQWHQPELRETCDILDAYFVEQEVRSLEHRHREALRWAYVWSSGPGVAARELGLTKDGLARVLAEARSIMARRLEIPEWVE